MFSSLSSVLFGNPNNAPDGTGTPASGGNAGDQQARVRPDRRIHTAEEEMGWMLVDVSRSSSPSLCGAQGLDPSLQRPDGTIFDGVLNLSSSASEAEEEDMDENKVMVDFSAQCPSIAESSGAEEEEEDAEEEDAEVEDAEKEEDSEEGDSEEGEVDASSSCSSLSVLFSESSEEECEVEPSQSRSTPRTPEPLVNLTESWMLTPPPCFTGTRVIRQIKANPLENRLIEQTSMYAFQGVYARLCFLMSETEEDRKIAEKNRKIADARDMLRRLVDKMRKLSRQVSEEQQGNSCLGDVHAPTPCALAAARECCGDVFRTRKMVQYQQLHQKAAAMKNMNKGCLQRCNKALMAQSRSKTSARNRLLRPSGGKSSRFAQRAQ